MADVVELVRRVDELQHQVDAFRQQLVLLRLDLQQFTAPSVRNGALVPSKGCLETAISLAEDLGPEFSSEDPHGLADRGAGWFEES